MMRAVKPKSSPPTSGRRLLSRGHQRPAFEEAPPADPLDPPDRASYSFRPPATRGSPMSKMFTRFLAVAALMCTAGVASATQFPNATCPDSVTIRQIQDVTAACHPAVGDTVRGVGGIIIGFDPIATGFDAYIQTTGGGPFTGID